MSIRSPLKTKTKKALLIGTLFAATASFGATGVASANSYNNNNYNWRYNDNNYNNGRNNCQRSFWIYNTQNHRWIKVGYNDRTDRWEVCRNNYNNYRNGNYNYDNDENYWSNNGRYSNRYY